MLFQLLQYKTVDGPVKVTTVYDLILANYGIDRGIGGEVATSYTDDTPYTPTWQEKNYWCKSRYRYCYSS